MISKSLPVAVLAIASVASAQTTTLATTTVTTDFPFPTNIMSMSMPAMPTIQPSAGATTTSASTIPSTTSKSTGTAPTFSPIPDTMSCDMVLDGIKSQTYKCMTLSDALFVNTQTDANAVMIGWSKCLCAGQLTRSNPYLQALVGRCASTLPKDVVATYNNDIGYCESGNYAQVAVDQQMKIKVGQTSYTYNDGTGTKASVSSAGGIKAMSFGIAAVSAAAVLASIL
ncbi:hypothetical protein HDV00_007419 [Rhizophlyctis rosea]|nr:hypothetical protein HDV00_007419 [Rhizophlyctis rosea]